MKRIIVSLLLLLLPSLTSAAELSVFAASSLTGALREVAASYQTQHPQERVLLHFAGSQSLAAQIEQGAPADLFISANNLVMVRLVDAGLVEPPQLVARNHLVVAAAHEITPPLRDLHDLARPGLLLVIGNPQVPVGRYTRQLFDRLEREQSYGPELIAAVHRNVVSQENLVKAIVTKLLLGEADAGIVYLSDLHGTALQRLTLPDSLNPQASYPAAVIKDGQMDQARRFLSYLRSPAGQQILSNHGLLPAGDLP